MKNVNLKKCSLSFFAECIFRVWLSFGILGLRLLCVHLLLNLINRNDIREKSKNVGNLCLTSMDSCSLAALHILAEFPPKRATYQIYTISYLKICSILYCWVSKIALYSPIPHFDLGKLAL